MLGAGAVPRAGARAVTMLTEGLLPNEPRAPQSRNLEGAAAQPVAGDATSAANAGATAASGGGAASVANAGGEAHDHGNPIPFSPIKYEMLLITFYTGRKSFDCSKYSSIEDLKKGIAEFLGYEVMIIEDGKKITTSDEFRKLVKNKVDRMHVVPVRLIKESQR